LREVRYWRARRASAEVVKPLADKSTASFGMTVGLRRVEGREQSFRIVGEDEADPSRGTVSYVSLARAVLTHGPGERVELIGGEAGYWTCGRKAGLPGGRRGKEAAALDAVGAALGRSRLRSRAVIPREQFSPASFRPRPRVALDPKAA
jgi:Transcription elongation factor, GreA/GreB, C-term